MTYKQMFKTAKKVYAEAFQGTGDAILNAGSVDDLIAISDAIGEVKEDLNNTLAILRSYQKLEEFNG